MDTTQVERISKWADTKLWVLYIHTSRSEIACLTRARFIVQLKSYMSLRALGGNNCDLRDNILQMAMSSVSQAAVALLLALLALTLLHLHGPTSAAVEHQLAALQAMQECSKRNLNEMELCQLIAAGLLAAQFEVCCPTNLFFHVYGSNKTPMKDRIVDSSYKNWLVCICSTKLLMDSSPKWQKFSGNSSMKVLLDWIHYIFVLKTFTVMYWPRHELLASCYPDPTYPCRPDYASVKVSNWSQFKRSLNVPWITALGLCRH